MMSTAQDLGRPIEILLVEDSPSDAGLTREAFKQGKVRNILHHVEDGEQAMDFLHRREPFGAAPRPDLVLLDLNLPRKDGREVLSDIRADPQLRTLIVVVLTTSKKEEDILAAYGLNSNAYIVKPVDLDQFMNAVEMIDSFWFTIVEIPPSGP